MFKLKINTESAAFRDPDADTGYNQYLKCLEIDRITKEVMKKVKAGWKEGKAIDINGNIVGHWELN